jgi:hypothetical protein
MSPADLARHAEQQASDAAYTRCVAQELRLRRLLAERAVDVVDELQGDLSYSEQRIARGAKVAA